MDFSVIIKFSLLLVVCRVSLSMLLKVTKPLQLGIKEVNEPKGFSSISEPNAIPENELDQTAKKLYSFVNMSLPYSPSYKIFETPVKVTKEENLFFFRQKPVSPLISDNPVALASYLNRSQNEIANHDSRVLMRTEANSNLDQTIHHDLFTSSAMTTAPPFRALIDFLGATFKVTFLLSRIADSFVRAIFYSTTQVSGESTEEATERTKTTHTHPTKPPTTTFAGIRLLPLHGDESTNIVTPKEQTTEATGDATSPTGDKTSSESVEALEVDTSPDDADADSKANMNYHYHYHYNKEATSEITPST